MTTPRRLYLLRHAKAAGGSVDHDRPLAPEGAKAASLVGQHVARSGSKPELVLCSTAARTVETAALVAEQLGAGVSIEHERQLYLATSDLLLRRLHAVEAAVASVMIVGHNPDLHELAVSLAAAGAAEQLTALRSKFPTGALAVFDCDIPAWPALRPGSARLDEFVVPKDLL